MVRPFFTNVRLLILTIILIVAGGLSAYQSLPRQEDPELVSRVAVITTAFPGASAERVEALVTRVLEEELAAIEEIDVLESDSRVGFSSVTVELVDSVTNTAPVWSRVRDEMDEAATRFPAGTTAPDLSEVLVKAYTVVAALTWDLPQEPNYALLRRYAEELGVALRGIDGTEDVDFFGRPEEEILVEINAPELVAVGLSAQELADQVALSDAKTSAGQLRSPDQTLAIEVDSGLESTEQIRQIPIRTEAGQFTRLGDIAQVRRGVRDPLTSLALIGGKPAVVVGAMMQSGQRIDQWGASAQTTLDDFRDRLSDGIVLEVIFDQSGYVETRISTLMVNLLLGAALVVGVTLLTMGWRSALVVGTALPFTVFAVFVWMTVLGVPIHQMSVTGLIIALGLLIDNAIVVVDEIQADIQQGADPLHAAMATVRRLQVPLLASTATTVLTFLPIYLLPGAAGEFVGTIALGVILALISSLAISLTLIAALAARVLGRRDQPRSQRRTFCFLDRPEAWWNEGLSLPGASRVYHWSIARMTARPLTAIALTLAIPLAGFIAAGTLTSQFFPQIDRDQFQIEIEFAPQTAIGQTRDRALQARQVILAHENVADVHWFVGESAPRVYYNIQGARQNQPYYAQAIVQLKSAAAIDPLVQSLQAELSDLFPAARIIAQKFQQGPPFDAPVELRLYGPNLDELRRLGLEVRGLLTTIPNVVQVRDSLSENRPQLALALDPEQVRQAGLTNGAIAQQLDAYSEGVTGGAILEATENLPVRVRLGNGDRSRLNTLASVDLQSPQSATARPASALGEFRLVPQLARIARRHEQRVNTVQAFITAGTLPSTVLTELQQRLEETNFELPPGYRYEFGGEVEQQDTAMGNLALFLPILLLGMVAALVLSLGSFRQAAIMGVVAVGSIGMALLSLKLFGAVLGFMAIVGTMGLIGVALNDSIVVLTALNEDPEASQGSPKAVQQVLLRATRHVLTTTATTIVGFVPLLLENDPFWRPLAIAIASGISGATLLALYFVPAAFLLTKRGQRAGGLPVAAPNRPLLEQTHG
ncbi:efflux RND transporter permease subunit [Nodosilinea sp. LEGE 06152]|uniref:efflux RND transporter permease subunit n=1 Tax=Nodosilinea sp. LEGE 06152 TaxID=2777966 RepID=UPI0018811A40|nr:efflux RND transporter permease subunit [Nodosilinea sp. LEGE 06152]MBE9157538.1 efflux RND transporter permease subunit [Nodosilinea sp. LEGE 06152]